MVGLSVIGILVLVVVGIITLFIVFSYGSLEPREIGILYNSIDKTIDREPYTGGAHFVGLFNSFIHFPGGNQAIEYSGSSTAKNGPLSARTSDGVAMSISVSFQYQLIPSELAALYEQSGTDYEKTFQNIARDILLQTSAKYQAKQFWTDRSLISESMLDSMKTALKGAHANCVSLQLLTVNIPDNLEKKIGDTQVEKQLSSTKVYEREAELIRQDIDILESACDQNITSITASAEAEAYYIIQVAEAAASKRKINIQSGILVYTAESLLFSANQMSDYLYLRAIEKQPDAIITVGLDSAVIQIKTG